MFTTSSPGPTQKIGRNGIGIEDEAPWRASPSGLRLIKTHHPATALPVAPQARYIAVVRDPKDVCVSGYRFLRSIAFGPTMPSVERWVDWFLSPEFPLGSWAAHLASFWARRTEANVLFLTYESMRGDLPGTVRRIGTFLDLHLTAAEIASITALSEFDAMRRVERKFHAPLKLPWANHSGSIVRRGQSGGSAELLTSSQQQRIDDHWRTELHRLHCDFPYEANFPAARTGFNNPP
jgi:hypothetical protein